VKEPTFVDARKATQPTSSTRMRRVRFARRPGVHRRIPPSARVEVLPGHRVARKLGTEFESTAIFLILRNFSDQQLLRRGG
jgi:hypothetical protein